MAGEAELEGRLLTEEAWRMLVKRYEFIGHLANGKRLLDVGCGGGLGLNYLLEAGVSHVTGIDLSEANLQYARNVAPSATFKQASAENLPFANQAFDVVSVMQVIQYLDIKSFLAEAFRVLTPSGQIIISLPNIQRADGFEHSRISRGYPTGTELFEKLGNAGFDVELFGLFPLEKESLDSSRRFLCSVRRKIIKIILAIPGGERAKDILVGRFLPRVPVHVVSLEDVESSSEPEIKLNPASDVVDYKILYAVGTKD